MGLSVTRKHASSEITLSPFKKDVGCYGVAREHGDSETTRSHPTKEDEKFGECR